MSIGRVVGGTCGQCVVQQVVIPHAFVERSFCFLFCEFGAQAVSGVRLVRGLRAHAARVCA